MYISNKQAVAEIANQTAALDGKKQETFLNLLEKRCKHHFSQNKQLVYFEPKTNAMLFIADEDGCPVAVGFSGKRTNQDWAYRFKTAERFEKYITEWMQKLLSSHNVKEKRKADKKALNDQGLGDDIKVGDIFVHSFGWDSTYNRFYQVVSISGKRTVHLKRIGSHGKDGGVTGNEYPIQDCFLDDEIIKKQVRISQNGKGEKAFYLSFSFGYAHKTEPDKAHHWSAY